MEQVTFVPTFAGWQKAARSVLHHGVAPENILWIETLTNQPPLALLDDHEFIWNSRDGPGATTSRLQSNRPPQNGSGRSLLVPKEFVSVAKMVALHSSEARWGLLYRLLWRLTHGEPKLLEVFVDPDVALFREMHKAIRHDVHKMRAFVRFREIKTAEAPWYVAWFEPSHHIVEDNASFFVDRFASMRWSILTPERCAHWDGKELAFTPGADRSQLPQEDAVESLWLTYYQNIFNPGRLKVHAMQAEMPKKYWKNLPEAELIPALVREAPERVDEMMKRSARKIAQDGGDEWRPASVPETSSLKTVREAALGCTACPLYKNATQTVFGEGPRNPPMMLVGEQPGDSEDLSGKPFVGPAGKIMDRALEEAGINRREVYVTNTVKHFKWEPRGKRRIHQKPNSRDIAACKPWLETELRLVNPGLVVCMGATAAQAFFGSSFRVTKERGKVLSSPLAPRVIATVHPSSLLRQPDEESREREYKLFVADLRKALKAAA